MQHIVPEDGNPQTDLAEPQWHYIDYTLYAILRRAQSWRCLDVVVKQGAVCHTCPSDVKGEAWEEFPQTRFERQAKSREADCFKESGDVLRPLFEERSKLYTKWLSFGNKRDR